jgi:hypothetical protein
MALALALAWGAAGASHAQTSNDLEQIRQEIQAIKQDYEKRIQELEKRLKQAEQAAQQAQASAQTAAEQAKASAQQAAEQVQAAQRTEPPQTAAPPAPAGGTAAQNAFNPAISLILQGAYQQYNTDPASRSVTGYLPPGAFLEGNKGFNLNETELTLSANVDQLFYGQATLAFAEGQVETEEAFVSTPALGHGLTLKALRFFSGIGYGNSVHAHAWDFVDPALVQQAFLGSNLGVDGVQASWIAPLPVYVELGGEIGNAVEFPFTDTSSKNGFSTGTLFGRLGGDIGTSHSYRLGAWLLNSQNLVDGASALDLDARTGVTNTLAGGNTRIWGLDFVYKWSPDGNPTDRNFKLVAEWMHRELTGDLTFDSGGPGSNTDGFNAKQSGWYAQGIYQFLPRWRAGLRYGQLDNGTISAGSNAANGITATGFSPQRWSAMVDWSPSEFSRLRLQYNNDRTQLGLDDHQLFLQAIFSLGTHGAHRY